jgi:hypothetical protein
MKHIYPFLVASGLMVASLLNSDLAKADIFGGDVAVLTQILQQTIQEIAIMRQTLDVAKGDSDLLQRANRDIDTALSEIYAIQDVVRETNEIGKTKDPVELLNRLRGIYGSLPRLGNIRALEFSDKVAGTGLGIENDSYAHAGVLDAAAVRLQDQAKTASPGKAQQLTAQSQTTIIHSLAQIERNGGTSARIEATQLAMKNNEEKNRLESFDQGYGAMTSSKAAAQSDLSLGSL